MIRFACLTLAAGLCLDLARATEPVGPDRVSSWRTTVLPPPAAGLLRRTPLEAALSPLETGALPRARPLRPEVRLDRPHALEGTASFYWQQQHTASGERFDRMAMTAAHRTLPFHTRVRVTHVGNGRSVVVRINDRGPFKSGRVIDLSWAAAGALGMHGHGLAKVKVEVLPQ
jgi:rare lipoprotein A